MVALSRDAKKNEQKWWYVEVVKPSITAGSLHRKSHHTDAIYLSFYLSKDHQAADWKTHKLVCSGYVKKTKISITSTPISTLPAYLTTPMHNRIKDELKALKSAFGSDKASSVPLLCSIYLAGECGFIELKGEAAYFYSDLEKIIQGKLVSTSTWYSI